MAFGMNAHSTRGIVRKGIKNKTSSALRQLHGALVLGMACILLFTALEKGYSKGS